MSQAKLHSDGSGLHRQEPEKRTEPRETGCIDRRDPNASLLLLDQVQISDLQLWIDLSA